MPAASTDVLVIGGGVIGVACCYELARRGAKVTLLDKGEIGHGCSYGNAGWITPCFALPIPMPGMFLQSLKWLIDPNGPLYIQPRPSRELAEWLWRFFRSMTRAKMLRSAAALIQLSKISLAAYRELDRQAPGAFGFTASGLLMVAHSDASMRAAIQEMNLVRAHGVPGRQLNAIQVKEVEPLLRDAELIGGVYFPDEAHVEPLATVKHLWMLAEANEATFVPGAEMLNLTRRNGKVVSVTTTRGVFAADQIVLATGAWTGRMAQKIGFRLPMMSGKGYAVIVPPLVQPLRCPIMFLDRKIAITPRNGSLRLAGTLELVGIDESVTVSRVQSIIRGAQSILPMQDQPLVREIWRGLRPCTPDGVPYIGKISSLNNVYVAAGHQMLGLQTAIGTGSLIADFITGQSLAVDPEPFRVERFR